MKKLSFYVMALAFCVLLVGAVAVSSPIEAGAFDTVGSAYVDVHMGDYNMVGLLTTSTNPSEPGGDAKAEYWTVSQTGEVEAYTGAGAPDASSYMHIGKSNDGSTIVLTLHNVAPERDVFYIEAGNTNVEIVLEGENILRGDYTYESDAALQARNFGLPYDAPAPSLTISGSGTLACYGADIVVESEEGGPIHEEMTRASGDEENYLSYGIYAEGDFTVKAGATVTGIGGDIDVEEADMAESHGLYAEGDVKVEEGAKLNGTSGDVTGEGTATVNCFGVGATNVTIDGSLIAKASSGKSGGTVKSAGVRVILSDGVTVNRGGYLKAEGGNVESEDDESLSFGLMTEGAETVTVNGEAELSGGSVTLTGIETDMSQTLYMKGSRGIFTENIVVGSGGKLTATGGKVTVSGESDKGIYAVSAGMGVGASLDIAEGAVVTANGGEAGLAEQVSGNAISMGVYFRLAGSGSQINPMGAVSASGDEASATLNIDGKLTATGGPAKCPDGGELIVSAGVGYHGDGGLSLAIGKTGDVTAKGGSAEGDGSISAGVYGFNMCVLKGGHVIADAAAAEAEARVALLLYDAAEAGKTALTLPDTYRWRTSADDAFTVSETQDYTFSANHTYVEIAPVSVAAESVTVEPGTLELEVSETGGLSAVIVPSIATDTVTWSSSDEGVASVGADGTVTGVASGTAVITVTAGNVSATCTVTVTAAEPEPTPTPGGPDINVGPVYEIELDEDIRGGTVSASLARASAGSTIRVTATPDEGWELLYVTVDGERIEGMSFKMPAHDVTVSAVFAGDLPFADVAEGAWYAEAVRWAASEGVVEGVSDTAFAPDDTVTREQLAAILARFMEL